MHLVFVILNSFLYSIRLLHRNHKPHDRKCQSMHYTYTPNHAPNKNAIHAPAPSASYRAPNENAIHAPALSASTHAPAPHALPLTHRTKLRTKKTGRQPAHADCLS